VRDGRYREERLKVETLRSAAVAYAARGWRVFPVQVRGKRPLFPKCQKNLDAEKAGEPETCKGGCGEFGHGLHDATSDPATVDAWWEVNPNANIGLHCGPGSGVWTLDVDTEAPKPRKAGGEICVSGLDALADLERAHGVLPATRRARTGRGGLHYLWRCPPGRKVGNKGTIVLPDGRRASIDVRAEGGYIVLAPSVHENGTPYRWLDEIEPTDAPAWLLDLVAPVAAERPARTAPARAVPEGSRERKYVAKVLDGVCADLAGMGEQEGSRHDFLFDKAHRLGGYIAGGYIDRGEVEQALYEAAAAAMGTGRDREIRRAIGQGLDIGQTKPLQVEDRPGYGPRELTPPAWLQDEEAPPYSDDEAPPERRGLRIVHPLPDVVDEDEVAAKRPGRRGVPSLDELAAGAIADGLADPGVNVLDATVPKINLTARQRVVVIGQAWRAVLSSNRIGQPRLFTQGGHLATIRRSEQGACIDLAGTANVNHLLYSSARWMRSKKAGRDDSTADGFIEVDAEDVPPFIAEDMVAAPAPELPVLEQVVYAPTFAADGKLLGEPGYHAEAHRWYEETRAIEPVPMTAAEARATLFDWLADFPFARDSDRAHAIALFLLPFVRDIVGVVTPVHLIEAPIPGTGKTLLARVLLSASMGREPALSPFDRDEKEVKKTITSMLIEGRHAVVFDNVKGRMDSPSFELATTAPRWADRILGVSGGVDVPIRAIWVVTANNLQMSPDLLRRSVRIRIVRLQEEAFDPAQARHPDIIGWTLENHSLLVSAGLKLVADWLLAGRPMSAATLGTYEDWSRVLGGILAHAGIPGFLADRDEFRDAADPVAAEWRMFVECWSKRHGTAFVTTKELLKLADEEELLGDVTRNHVNDARGMAFGRALAGKVDNVIAGHRLIRKRSGRDGYVLVPVAAKVGAS
jgi:hypothetical protein